MNQSKLRLALTSVALLGLLTSTYSLFADSLLLDRGLPTANLNDPAGYNRANFAWAAAGYTPNDYTILGDSFVNTSSSIWSIDTIRLWAVSSLATVTLWGGIHGSGVYGSTAGTIAATTYAVNDANGHNTYQAAGIVPALYYGLWQLDFPVHATLAPGQTNDFFLDGTGNTALDPSGNALVVPYLHVSNAALSGSPQQGADGLILYGDVVNGILEVASINSIFAQADVNVQVFGVSGPPGALYACTNSQTSLPTYGTVPAPTAGKDSLIFITHGWIPYGEDPIAATAWVDQMSNSIVQYLAANHISHWQVEGYKWITGAQPANLDLWSAAQAALIAGEGQGVIVGSHIASQAWASVHLIAHSAGAGLIDLASAQIKAFSPSTVVQCTFLDPFVGLDNSGYADYGSLADWSDNYFSRDVVTGQLTEGSLDHAYNVDVSQLDISDRVQLGFYISSAGGTFELNSCYKTESTHGWPIAFYSNTITGNGSPDYISFGFPLSQEGGLFSAAEAIYTRGNNPAQVLGTADPTCSQNTVSATLAGAYSKADFLGSIVGQSITGTIQKFQNAAIKLFTGSPVWVATVITPTNSASLVSFDAQFTSATGSHGLLSVYWDTGMIGLVDEVAVQPGLQHYSMAIPVATAGTSHILGLHLDPFTSTQSGILLTNVFVVSAGVTQPFSLSFTTNVVSRLRVLQLTGQSGFNYTVQASTDLANWTNIAILANTNGAVLFVDPDSANYPFRFYRAVVP